MLRGISSRADDDECDYRDQRSSKCGKDECRCHTPTKGAQGSCLQDMQCKCRRQIRSPHYTDRLWSRGQLKNEGDRLHIRLAPSHPCTFLPRMVCTLVQSTRHCRSTTRTQALSPYYACRRGNPKLPLRHLLNATKCIFVSVELSCRTQAALSDAVDQLCFKPRIASTVFSALRTDKICE